MKNLLSISVVVGALFLGSAGIASAHDGQMTQKEFEARAKRLEQISERMKRMEGYEKMASKIHGGNHGPKSPVVPELDPSGAASVVSLVLAAGLVLSHRRKTVSAV